MEEWGHYLDSVLNEFDSNGDEGEIFAHLIKGFNFDIEALKQENDHAFLDINGSAVIAEQAAFGTVNLPTSWVAYRSDRGSILAFRRDATVSALTDIYFQDATATQGQFFDNIQSSFSIFNGQFSVTTRVSNTRTEIRPDGTIGFRSGFIQPRLTVNAPRWTRFL